MGVADAASTVPERHAKQPAAKRADGYKDCSCLGLHSSSKPASRETDDHLARRAGEQAMESPNPGAENGDCCSRTRTCSYHAVASSESAVDGMSSGAGPLLFSGKSCTL